MNAGIGLGICDVLKEIRDELRVRNELQRELIYELREIRSKI